MKNDWLTKNKDMNIAQTIMGKYAKNHDIDSLGLFELIVNPVEKRMNFRLATWVIAIAHQFKAMYGSSQGDYVTRQVIGHCLTQGQTIH